LIDVVNIQETVGKGLSQASVVGQVKAKGAGVASSADLSGAVGDGSRGDASVVLEDEVGDASCADVGVGSVSQAVHDVLKLTSVADEVVVNVAGGASRTSLDGTVRDGSGGDTNVVDQVEVSHADGTDVGVDLVGHAVGD